MLPTEICTYSPFHPTPPPPQNTQLPQDVPEVTNSGAKDFAKMAFLLQLGQKEQSAGSGGSTLQGLSFLRAGECSVTQQVGKG